SLDQSDDTNPSSTNEAESASEADDSEMKDAEHWRSATDVPDEVIDRAWLIGCTPLPSEKPQDRQHVFRIAVEHDGELFVRVHKGVRAFGDYPLTEDYNAVVNVPAFPLEVQIEGDGGLLALNGEKKLSIRSRGLCAIEYEVARVATSQINHLVS